MCNPFLIHSQKWKRAKGGSRIKSFERRTLVIERQRKVVSCKKNRRFYKGNPIHQVFLILIVA